MKKIFVVLSLISALCIASPITTAATVTYSDGDIDGDGSVTSHDGLLAVQYLKGSWYTTNNNLLDAIDANNDYIIDYVDVQYIFNNSVGIN